MKIKKTGWMAAALALAAAALVAQQTAVLERVPHGQLVLAMAGRYNLDSLRTGQLTGYGTLIHGFPNAALFNGEPSEQTARFTVVSSQLRLDMFRVGPLIHARPNPVNGDAVRFRIYYDEFAAGQDLTRAETLANGRLIATFRARPWSFTAVPLLMAHAEGVMELESSDDFTFQGQRINLRQVVTAMRMHVHGGPVPGGRSSEPFLSFPIAATGIAAEPFPPRAQ